MINETSPKTMIFPTLIGTFYSNMLNITNSWRHQARNKTKQAFSWDEIVASCLKKDLQSVYKELCHLEIPNEILKRQKKRNDQRLALSIILLRQNITYDVFIHLVPFTKFT